MSDELKPVRCGCGGKAKIVKRFSPDYGLDVLYVKCEECGTETDDLFTEAEAVEAWNRAMSGSAEEKLKAFWDGMSAEMKQERTAKVEKVDTNSPHSQVYKCRECGQYTHRTTWSRDVHYCPSCGCRLEWK